MLDRRKFIKATAALSTFSIAPIGAFAQFNETLNQSGEKPDRILPLRLEAGNTIGLVTPGSPITKEQLEKTVKKLEDMGFKTYYKESVLSEYGYFAGHDDERAEELMSMFTNPNVDAILCVRGGYGSIRILDKLDYELIKQNPKAFIGYSDITALITAIYQKTGLVTYHGPVGISPSTDFTDESFKRVLIDPTSRYKYPYLREAETEDNPEFDIYTINPGKAKGELIGGNISVLDSMIGSNYEPDFENKIVYLEEIGEKTYRVDKMLYHLIYATNLKKAAGIVMGVFGDCNINEEPTISLKQAIEDLIKPLDIPAFYGFSFGHIDTMITIPTGIRAKMNSRNKTLTLLEKAVI